MASKDGEDEDDDDDDDDDDDNAADMAAVAADVEYDRDSPPLWSPPPTTSPPLRRTLPVFIRRDARLFLLKPTLTVESRRYGVATQTTHQYVVATRASYIPVLMSTRRTRGGGGTAVLFPPPNAAAVAPFTAARKAATSACPLGKEASPRLPSVRTVIYKKVCCV
jgi:hypothetical protein